MRLKDTRIKAADWTKPFIPEALHMKDYADEVGYKQKSAPFIDAVIFEDRIYRDRLLIHIDAWSETSMPIPIAPVLTIVRTWIRLSSKQTADVIRSII